MMIDSRTSCRKVWAIQAMRVLRPPLIASGRLMRAMIVNAYAHHIVPTTFVILTASQLLNPDGLSTVVLAYCFRLSICG
jgi:hypothetical protein